MITNVFSDHRRSIIHIHKYNVASNRLMIDMVLNNKAGIEYTKDVTILLLFMVF